MSDISIKKYKRRVIYISVFIFLVITTMVLFALLSKERYEKRLFLTAEESIVKKYQKNIENTLEDLINDLIILSQNSQIKVFWDNEKNNDLRKGLTENLKVISTYRRVYDQIRILDTFGNEVIRVNYNRGKPEIVKSENLQNKGDRYYFKETLKLKNGDIYISPLDLNKENGEIENPLKPMIRIGTPLYDRGGDKKGVLIFNYKAKTLIDKITNHENTLINGRVMLVNIDGYFLKGLSAESEWGFMYDEKKDITFQNEFPLLWKNIISENFSQVKSEKGFFTYNTIYPIPNIHNNSDYIQKNIPLEKVKVFPEHYYWKLVSYITREDYVSKINNYRKIALLIFIALSIILFLVSMKVYKAQLYKLKSQKRIKEIKNRFEMVMNSIDAVVYVCDMDTYDLLFANKLFVDTFGEYKGQKCYATLQKGQTEKCSFCTNHLLLDNNGLIKEPYVWEFQNTKNFRWYQCRDQAVRWTDGKMVRLEIAVDITELKEAESQLKLLNTNKDKLFSIISHDLKGPVGTVLGVSDLLVQNFEEYDAEKRRKYINSINQGIQNSYILLENLLLWSRSEKKDIVFNPEKYNLCDTVNEVVELLFQMADFKKIIISNNIANNVHGIVDKSMFLTIMRNLVSNAIKFTPKGGAINVQSRKLNIIDSKEMIEIAVVDNGIGISNEKIEKLFNGSENMSTLGTEEEKGTGLGLYICKDFVEQHGGKIRVESKEIGSEFIFTIPYVK